MRDITETNLVTPQVKDGYPLNYSTGLKELYLNLKRGRRTTSPVANCSKPNCAQLHLNRQFRSKYG